MEKLKNRVMIMLKRNLIYLSIIVLLVLSNCSKKEQNPVTISPVTPIAGDNIKIAYKPNALKGDNQEDFQIILICQVYGNQGVEVLKKSMIENDGVWNISIQTEPTQYLLRLKFEDKFGRVDDQFGVGWNVGLRDENGEMQKNAHYQMGLNCLDQPIFLKKPDHKKAIEEFEIELSFFPKNYDTWFELWYLKLKNSENMIEKRSAITVTLDSLIEHNPPSLELKLLEFNAAWKLLNDQKRALKVGQEILDDVQNLNIADEVNYKLIFIKNRDNPNSMIQELTKLSRNVNNENVLKDAYYMLGRTYQQFNKQDSAMHYFQKYLELEPNDISVSLTIASYQIKMGIFEEAQRLLDKAKNISRDDYYLNNFPWQRPEQRNSTKNLDLCQIYSTEAQLNFEMKDYPLSIENRKQCIDLATPFPAYEFQKIGDAYMKMGKVDSAKMFYLKAISKSEEQNEAIDRLKFIYQNENETLAGFDEYLKNAVQKELKRNAVQAPDFELTDLEGKKFKLYDQKGKIVVLTFWDSWSTGCQKQFSQLNELKEMFDEDEVVFAAISVEASVSLKRFLSQHSFLFRQLHSGYHVKKLYSIIGFPTHLIIDQEGRIRFKQVGFTNNVKNKLKQQIDFLVAENTKVLG